MSLFASKIELDDLAGDTGDRGDLALVAATNNLVAALGWDPRQSQRTWTAEPDRVVFLPARNVTAVASVITSDGFTVPAGDYRWLADGRLFFTAPYRWWPYVTISYTAGWPDEQLPQVLETVCLEEAVRWLDANGQRLRSHTTTLGGETETHVYDTDPSAALTADFRLADLRVPAVA